MGQPWDWVSISQSYTEMCHSRKWGRMHTSKEASTRALGIAGSCLQLCVQLSSVGRKNEPRILMQVLGCVSWLWASMNIRHWKHIIMQFKQSRASSLPTLNKVVCIEVVALLEHTHKVASTDFVLLSHLRLGCWLSNHGQTVGTISLRIKKK